MDARQDEEEENRLDVGQVDAESGDVTQSESPSPIGAGRGGGIARDGIASLRLTDAQPSAPKTNAVRGALAAHDWDLILGNHDLDEYERICVSGSGAQEDVHIPAIGALNIDYRMLTRISENEQRDVRMLNTFLEPPAIKALVYALVRSKTVYSLTLSGCGLDDRSAYYLAQLLRSQQSIEMLDLSDNALTDMGIVPMIDGIKVHPVLRHFYLGFNSIGPNGALMISSALKLMRAKLQSLDLSHNKIADTGAFAFAEALATNKLELESLYLVNCGIEGPGAIALGNTLKVADKLQLINICDNPIDDDAAHELKEVTKATGKMIKVLTGLGTLNRTEVL